MKLSVFLLLLLSGCSRSFLAPKPKTPTIQLLEPCIGPPLVSPLAPGMDRRAEQTKLNTDSELRDREAHFSTDHHCLTLEQLNRR